MFGIRLLISVSNVFVVYLLFNNFLNLKPEYEKKRLQSAVILVAMATLFTGIKALQVAWLNPLLFILATYFFSSLLWQDEKRRRLLLSVCIASLDTVVEAISLLIAASILEISFLEASSRTALLLPMSITSQLLLILVVSAINACFPKRLRPAGHNWSDGGLFFVPLFSIFSVYLTVSLFRGYSFSHSDTITLTLIGICLMLSSAVSFFVYDSGESAQELKYMLQLSEMGQKAQELYYVQRELDNKEYRGILHDIKGQLLNCKMLAQQQDPALLTYMDEIILRLSGEYLPAFSTVHNSVLNILIEKTRAACEAEGIRFDAKLECVEIQQLSLMDTGILFDNLFENALAACRVVPPTQERLIALTIRYIDNHLAILLKNSKQSQRVETRNGILISSKRQGKQFGQGFENIKQTVRKNGGSLSYLDEGTTFVVNITFPLDV